MLNDKFVPVAIDQWYERRQQDAKGDFYRKIAAQGPRSDFEQTTQGHYLCGADGTLLGFNANHVDLGRIRKVMRKALSDFDVKTYEGVAPVEPGNPDTRFNFHPPEGGLVIQVYSRILDGYDQPKHLYDRAFQKSIGQDKLWIQAEEKAALIKAVETNGELPAAISNRIARFNLIDNTRGEPDRWTQKQVRSIKLQIEDGKILGTVKIETEGGKRGYEADLYGHISFEDDEITRFNLVALGEFWGQGRFTGRAPKGKFPLAITFRIDESGTADRHAIPHGAKGWLDGYYQTGASIR